MVLQPPIWADLRPGVDPLLGGPQLLAPGPCFSRPISPGMPPRITPVGPLWTPVSGPMPPVQLPWPGPGSGSGEPQLQILPPMPRVGKESLALGTFHPSTLSPRKFNLPEDLLSRIEGVVTNMEKNVAEEQRLRISEAVCSSCGAALTGDARFCDRCGRQQVDHAPEDDLVQNLAQRLESLESRRQVAEQRATQLEELRRLVAEGRHKQYLTHFITLDDHGFDLQKRENGSAASTQSTGSREVKSAEDSQLHAALAQVEDAFTEELNVLGVAGAESRLHERLERLLKAVLHRESVAEARLKEQRELTHAAERELQVLEETSQKVLEDCRLLQARVRELEHHETNSHHHRQHATELEERVKEHSRLLELAHTREAAFREDIQKVEALEQENEELRELHIRQQQRAQEQLDELQEELARAKEQLEDHMQQHGDLRGHNSHLESQWQSAEQRAMHHATRAEELAEQMRLMDEGRHQHRETLEQEVVQQRQKIQGLEGALVQLGQDAQKAEDLAQEQIEVLQERLRHMEALENRPDVARIEERNMELMREVDKLRSQLKAYEKAQAQPPSPPIEPLRRSSIASNDSDFRSKVSSVKRRASELLRQAAAPNSQLLDVQIRAGAQSWQEGGSFSAGLHSNADEASIRAEWHQLSVLVDAAACDLAALKEEASTHHELPPQVLEEVMQEIELAWANCKDETGMLQSSSALDGMSEAQLQSLAADLGYLDGSHQNAWKEETPMHWAAAHGRRDLAEFLLRQDQGEALLRRVDHEGRIPAEVAERHHQVSMAQFLRGHMQRKPPKKVTLEDSLPPAYQQVLKQVVQEGWGSVHWKDGFTMLHWAASKGEVELARYLLQLRADPEARDDTHHRTPLDWAEHEGHSQAAEMLRRQSRSRLSGRLSSSGGAFRQARSSLPAPASPSYEAANRRKSEAIMRRRSSRRKSTIPEGYLPVLEEIDQRGWNNMQWTRGFTLLHWAAQNDKPDLVEQLFAKAADPMQQDDDGRTALDFARESGSPAVVEALQRYAPPQARQQREDNQRQMTDLMLSARRSQNRVSIAGADDME
ncbi:unnamed protein product [Durusdinium trenchii]|uniref:Uncharacterized protein n=1 Tax=Durusdinium trenchii TaxID=1381693 RepID=A0ABP0HC84_9DINO